MPVTSISQMRTFLNAYTISAAGEAHVSRQLNRALCAWVATVVVATGCASGPRYDPRPVEEGRAGVLWKEAHYKKEFFERRTIARVLRIDAAEIGTFLPENLVPGRHSIEIRYDRESLLCGYLGCVEFEQARRSFELVVESEHSYMPFALRRCDKDWIGIFDTGRPARDDIATWTAIGNWAFQNLSRIGDGRTVVAGDSPPEHCGTP
jgi:hypothetical protein